MAARDEKNRKRSQSGSYYTYGNVAYELQPDYTPYRVREEEEERRREAGPPGTCGYLRHTSPRTPSRMQSAPAGSQCLR